MAQITVTLTFDPEREDLHHIAELFQGLTPEKTAATSDRPLAKTAPLGTAQTGNTAAAAPADTMKPAATSDRPLAKTAPIGTAQTGNTAAAAPADTMKPAAATVATTAVTREGIQGKVVELCGVGKKQEVREIIKQYADRISDMPDEVLPEVMQRLEAIV